MDIERALETQRLKLLRFLAGLLSVVAFFSFRPFSPAVSAWVAKGAASMLSRAEAAAQCLVIAQARLIAAKTGSAVDFERFSDFRIPGNAASEDAGSLCALRERLEALRALLEDLPRFGLRLLRQTEKRVRRLLRKAHHVPPCPDTLDFEALCAWRLASIRIERPPDKVPRRPLFYKITSPRQRAGGE